MVVCDPDVLSVFIIRGRCVMLQECVMLIDWIKRTNFIKQAPPEGLGWTWINPNTLFFWDLEFLFRRFGEDYWLLNPKKMIIDRNVLIAGNKYYCQLAPVGK